MGVNASRFPTRSTWACAALFGSVSCASPAPPPRAIPPPSLPAAVPMAPPATYWRQVDVVLPPGLPSLPEPPYADEAVMRLEGAEAAWRALPRAVRDRVLQQGFATTGSATQRTRVGAFYTDLAARRLPFVVTFDALLGLTHLGLDRALAEVEERTLLPNLLSVMDALESRLGEESKVSPVDLAAAYRVARGVVAVARALLGGSPPADLADRVHAELALLANASGPSESPILGGSLDYRLFVPRGAIGADVSPRAGPFRAAAWLSQAPLLLVSADDVRGAPQNVTRVRTHAKAALLLARALDFEIDPETARAYDALNRVARFVFGPADDLGPLEFAAIASRVGLRFRDLPSLAEVTHVDRARHSALVSHVPKVYDGAVPIFVTEAVHGGFTEGFARAALSVRFLPAARTPETEALQGLVFSARSPSESASSASTVPSGPPSRPRLLAPSALHVGAWLGSDVARALLRESATVDAEEQAAIDRLVLQRNTEDLGVVHATVVGSLLDALAAYLRPSAADVGCPAARSNAWRAHKLEAVFAGYTFARHEADWLTRQPNVPPIPPPVFSNSRVPGWVEAHPEAIAKLLALTEQAQRGLEAVAGLVATSMGRAILDEVHALLSTALNVSVAQARGESPGEADRLGLAQFAARLAALDSRLEPSRAADLAMLAELHADPSGDRMLVMGTGAFDELVMIVREPVTGRPAIAFGAASTHHEMVLRPTDPRDDASWRARLESAPPPRHTFTSRYRSGLVSVP